MELLQEKWPEIKRFMQTEYSITDVSFRTWIEPLQIYKIEGNVLTLMVDKDPSLQYIKTKYSDFISVSITEVTGREYELKFVSPSTAAQQDIDRETAPVKFNKNMRAIEKAGISAAYTFDTFVVGKNNQYAHAAALAVAESPGTVYNPLFFCGGSGLGKTHLMQAIANYIIEHDPDKKVLYVTSETFTNDFVEAIRLGKGSNINAMGELREKYRNTDVLLIDDIQFILDKYGTLEEFFNIFNIFTDLHKADKQIIISSDVSPKDMDNLHERYRSRFTGGFVQRIFPPDYETRIAILKNKQKAMNLPDISDDVLDFIATHITSNIRTLEGSLKILSAYINLNKEPISVSVAEQALQDIIIPGESKKVTPQLILEVVADHYQIPVEEIKSSKRKSEIVLPRHITMYLCRKLTDATLESIGNMLGGRDHSTVDNGEKTIAEKIEKDEILANTVDIIIKKINPA